MRRFRAAALVLATALPLPALHSQEAKEMPLEMLLETVGDNILDAQHCDMVHNLKTCSAFHFVPPAPVVSAGSVVRLDDTLYLVEWMGPGYYLESGIVLHAAGPALPGLLGQAWEEAYPAEGTIHVSRAWGDRNADGSLNRADTLLLDSGRELKVKDVRLNFRVRRIDLQ
jgi:hypothetical protein